MISCVGLLKIVAKCTAVETVSSAAVSLTSGTKLPYGTDAPAHGTITYDQLQSQVATAADFTGKKSLATLLPSCPFPQIPK